MTKIKVIDDIDIKGFYFDGTGIKVDGKVTKYHYEESLGIDKSINYEVIDNGRWY